MFLLFAPTVALLSCLCLRLCLCLRPIPFFLFPSAGAGCPSDFTLSSSWRRVLVFLFFLFFVLGASGPALSVGCLREG